MEWRPLLITASVGLREDHLAGVPTRLARMHAHRSVGAGSLERDATHRRLGLLLDGGLTGGLAAVRGVDEAVLDHLLELVVRLGMEGLLLPEVERALVQRVVERRQRGADGSGQLTQRDLALVSTQAVG